MSRISKSLGPESIPDHEMKRGQLPSKSGDIKKLL
jgi:hypothetical protein